MSMNNTSHTGGSGAGIGTKIRGAAEVVHGIRDNIRGTFLGAVDTATGHQSENDDIVAQGRMEASQGMAKVHGAGAGANTGYESRGGFDTGTDATGSQGMTQGAGDGTSGGHNQTTSAAGMGGKTQQEQSDYQQQPLKHQQSQLGGSKQDQQGDKYGKD